MVVVGVATVDVGAEDELSGKLAFGLERGQKLGVRG